MFVCKSDNYDPLTVRRIRVHYLGYSEKYDEWLCVDSDSHRMAQRGTYTVGADLRAAKKNRNREQIDIANVLFRSPLNGISIPLQSSMGDES